MWNEPRAGNHHSPHELGATLEGSSVREHRPQLLLHSPASQLAAQVLFTCAAAQHDAAPQQQNSEVQAHAHSNRDHSDSPRPHAQRPASYYSCSEGGVIKYEAREFSSRICSIGLHHTAARAAAKATTSRHVGVRQQWSAVLSHCTACEHEAFGLGDQQASDSSSLCVGSQSCRGGIQR